MAMREGRYGGRLRVQVHPLPFGGQRKKARRRFQGGNVSRQRTPQEALLKAGRL